MDCLMTQLQFRTKIQLYRFFVKQVKLRLHITILVFFSILMKHNNYAKEYYYLRFYSSSFNLDLVLLGLVLKIRVLAYLTLILNPKPKLLRWNC